MTRAQILRALEICTTEGVGCTECLLAEEPFCGSKLLKAALEQIKRDQRCGICAHFVASSLRCALPTGEGTFTMAGCTCGSWKGPDDEEGGEA